MRYPNRIEVTFYSDRPITEKEMDDLVFTVQVQVMEPQTLPTPDSDWEDAEYTTSDVTAVSYATEEK